MPCKHTNTQPYYCTFHKKKRSKQFLGSNAIYCNTLNLIVTDPNTRGLTAHRSHGSVHTLESVQYEFGTTGKKQQILNAHLFCTDSSAHYSLFHLAAFSPEVVVRLTVCLS